MGRGERSGSMKGWRFDEDPWTWMFRNGLASLQTTSPQSWLDAINVASTNEEIT